MNFDACRDLSGRRIRHVRAQQELEQWHKERNEEDKKIEEELDEYKKHEREIKAAIRNNDANKEAMISKYTSQMNLAANNISNGVLLGKAKLKRKHKELLEMPENDRKNNIKMDIDDASHEQLNHVEQEDMFFQSNKRKMKRFKIEEDHEKEFKEDKDIPEEESLMVKQKEPTEFKVEELLQIHQNSEIEETKDTPVTEKILSDLKEKNKLDEEQNKVSKDEKLNNIFDSLEKVANLEDLKKFYTTEQIKDNLTLLG